MARFNAPQDNREQQPSSQEEQPKSRWKRARENNWFRGIAIGLFSGLIILSLEQGFRADLFPRPEFLNFIRSEDPLAPIPPVLLSIFQPTGTIEEDNNGFTCKALVKGTSQNIFHWPGLSIHLAILEEGVGYAVYDQAASIQRDNGIWSVYSIIGTVEKPCISGGTYSIYAMAVSKGRFDLFHTDRPMPNIAIFDAKAYTPARSVRVVEN